MEFKQAVNIVLEMEGGYVNDPQDPGGETRWGISKRAYPDLDIANLSKGHAKDIYKRDYWNACMCEGLPESLRLMVFDCAVNQGVYFASMLLQKLVRAKEDGKIGPQTLGQIEQFNVKRLVERYALGRLDRYMDNRNFFRFGKGWIRRLIHITVKTQQGAGE